jgi:hypothetical protein
MKSSLRNLLSTGRAKRHAKAPAPPKDHAHDPAPPADVGWHESSYELLRGVEVIERDWPDSAIDIIPFEER